jgi:hypothetical protein
MKYKAHIYIRNYHLYFANAFAFAYERFFLLEKFKRHDIPYFSQFESRELIEDLLTAKIRSNSDPKWHSSGAESVEEYEQWSWNICGIACLKMILAFKLKKNYATIGLAKKALEYDAYKIVKSHKDIEFLDNRQIFIEFGKSIEGMGYRAFCKFLKEEFRLKARVAIELPLSRIKYELHKNNFVIISVHLTINRPEAEEPEKKGGHLVLVTGFDNKKKTLTIHNPSGFFNKSQEHLELSEKDFRKFYAGRGIIIYNK